MEIEENIFQFLVLQYSEYSLFLKILKLEQNKFYVSGNWSFIQLQVTEKCVQLS